MQQEYIFPKTDFKLKDIYYISLHFDNGDYLEVGKSEIAEISVNLYDRLVWNGRGFNPVIESGYLKLRIKEKAKLRYHYYFLYNPKEYKRNRKAYIENRCINQYGLKCIQLFNENNYHITLFGDTISRLDDDYLVIKFLPRANYGSCDGRNHMVYLNDIDERMVNKINLDFENCDGFTVYNNEILDIKLIFDDILSDGGWDLSRKIKSGYILLQLNESIYDREESSFFSGCKKKSIKQLTKRICGNRYESEHDICHLYIEYDNIGYDGRRTECLVIDDIRPEEEIERLEKLEEEGLGYLDFIGGYAKLRKDGTILITFGKEAKEILDRVN